MNYIYFNWVFFLLRLIDTVFRVLFFPLLFSLFTPSNHFAMSIKSRSKYFVGFFFFALFPPKTLKLKHSPRLEFAHWRCDKLLQMQYRLSFLNRYSSSCARNLIKSHFYTCITTARWSSIGGLASNTWLVANVSGLWFCQRKEEWNTFI